MFILTHEFPVFFNKERYLGYITRAPVLSQSEIYGSEREKMWLKNKNGRKYF